MVSLRHLLTSRLGVKLIGASLILVVLLASLAMYSVARGRDALIEAVGNDTVFLAQTLSSVVDRTLYLKHHELWFAGSGDLAQRELAASNAAFDAMEDPEAYIDAVDAEWRSTPASETTASIDDVLQSNLSRELWNMLDTHYEAEHGVDIYLEVMITNRYGAVVAMSVRTSGYGQDGTSWWNGCLEAGSYFGPVEYEEDIGLYGMYISSRLLDSEGSFVGIIAGFINIVAVAEEAGFLMVKFETTEIFILTQDGRLIYSTSTFHMLEDMSGTDYYLKATEQSGYFLAERGERSRLFSYTHSTGYLNYDGRGWMVLVSQDEAEVLSPVADLTTNTLVVSVVVIGLAVASSYSLSMRISRPVRELAESARHFSKGDLDRRVDVRRADEIGQLASSFNEMAGELKSLYSDLEVKVEERTREVEAANEKLHILGSITRHDSLNQLSIIRGWMSMIEEGARDTKTLEHIRRVITASETLEDLLKFTGTYEKVGVTQPEWVDVKIALDSSLPGLDLRGAKVLNGLKGLSVLADPMFPKVLRNLAENSVKHGQRTARISFSYEERPDGLVIVAEDDGVGVPEARKAKLFDRVREPSGRVGYGLYLSRAILAITGVTIQETGTPGQGARFEVTVPEGKYRLERGTP